MTEAANKDPCHEIIGGLMVGEGDDGDDDVSGQLHYVGIYCQF